MIIEYSSQYDEEIKKLFEELQDHLIEIDKEAYSKKENNYKEEYFNKTLDEINKYQGKMYLYKNDKEIVGLVVGLINNDEIDSYDYRVPKTRRITELIISSKYRKKGYGSLLLNSMEQYLKSVGCQDILLGVFAYNESVIKLYEKNGYHTRLVEMIKKDI